MGAHTDIEWAHSTFNPWQGCTQVSPGCARCYAMHIGQRFGVKWGIGQTRRLASERTWAEPVRWNAVAERDGERRRVFCASMADVFDNESPVGARERLWNLIDSTPHLDWLLLTKRIGNVLDMIPKRWLDSRNGLPAHIWLGATIVNQEEADRDIPKLLRVPAAVRFLSCEPLLGQIELFDLNATGGALMGPAAIVSGGMTAGTPSDPPEGYDDSHSGIDWVIAGAESGRGARPCELGWIRELRDQCSLVGVPFFFKQHVHQGIKTSTPELDGRRWVEVPEVAA